MPPRWMWLSGPHGPFGIHRALAGAVVGRIGIDQDPGGAALLRRQRLEAAVAVRHRVADEHDLAAHVDAAAGERVVVRRIAAARVDDRRGDVAGRGVGVIRQARPSPAGSACTDRPESDPRASTRATRDGAVISTIDFLRPRQQHFVGRDLDALEAELDEPIARATSPARGRDRIRRGAARRRSTRCSSRMRSADGQGQEPAFELGLGGGAVAREPEDAPAPAAARAATATSAATASARRAHG